MKHITTHRNCHWLVNGAKHTLGESTSSHSCTFVQPEERIKATFTCVPVTHLREVLHLHLQWNLISFGYKTVCTLYEAVLVTKRPPILTVEFCNCKPDQIFHNPYFASHSNYLSCTVRDRHSTSWYTYCCFTGPYIRKYTQSLLGKWSPLAKV
jgi:hypothetical protein